MARSEPAVLGDIMDTIASLKESNGSPPDKIIDHLANNNKSPVKNSSLMVKKALRTGLKSGLLREKDGKFKLGLTPKDYATLRRFRFRNQADPFGLGLMECRGRRRGKKKRGRSRRRSKKRRRSDYSDTNTDTDTSSASSEDIVKSKGIRRLTASIPLKEIRRRRKNRLIRGGKRKRLDYELENTIGTDCSDEPMDKSKRRRRSRSKRRKGKKRRHADMDEDNDSTISSTPSKEVTSKSSDEKTKDDKSKEEKEKKDESNKRDIEPPKTPRNDHPEMYISSDHCIHEHDYPPTPYSHYSPHYGGHYYE